MTESAAPARRRFRRPTLGQWVGLIAAEALVWLVAVVADGYADWRLLPWVIAAGMVLVLLGWLARLRSPQDPDREGTGGGGHRSTVPRHDGTTGSGSA